MTGASGGRGLKVLEVASGLPQWGGTEIHLVNLTEQLRRRGHDAEVLCQPGSFVEAEVKKRSLPFQNATCSHQSNLGALPQLLSVIRRGNYDVVHVHWAPDYIMPPLAARLAGVPVVLMSHHSPHPMKKGKTRRYLWKHGLFNRMIALSESVRSQLLSQGFAPELVTTIHHGTDTDAFVQTTLSSEAVRGAWGLPLNYFLVGIAGRVSTEKGVDDFIAALDLLRDLPVHGVVIGDGISMEAIRVEVKERKLESRVTFAGFRSDINNAINALDALVLASTWAEPCAAVIQQAMALGKPVIGTNLGGTPEMIEADKTGILVPPHSPPDIADAIRCLYGNPALAQSMGAAGKVRVDPLFTQAYMVDRIEGLYQEEREKASRGQQLARKEMGKSL